MKISEKPNQQYFFMVGDSVLNANEIKLVCGIPASLVPNYSSKAEALNALKQQIEFIENDHK